MNKRLWIAILLLVVLGAGAYVWWRQQPDTQAQTRAPAWRTTEVTRGDLIVTVNATGSIRPSSQVEVKSRATGVVTAVVANEGDRVVKDQVLVRISDPDSESAVRAAAGNLGAAQAQLARARAQQPADRAADDAAIRQAQASLLAAQARLRQLDAGTRREEIAQAEQSVLVAQAEAELAQRTHERNQQLFAQGFIARAQVDQSETALRTAQAQARSAGERLNLLRAGSTQDQIAEARASVRQAEASLAAARARRLATSAKTADVAQAEAQVTIAHNNLANARQRLAETIVRAPVAGIVSARAVEVGQTVIGSLGSGGTSVFTIAVDAPLLAKVMVDETDVAQIRPGLPVTIRADGVPNRAWKGTVQAVSPNAQVVNNVVQYQVTSVVRDPEKVLRLGLTVDAEFVLMERRNVLLVPNEALRGAEDARALMIPTNDKLVPRIVEVGGTDSRLTEIKSGARQGETVYLGEARRAPDGKGSQPRSPFLPNFQRSPSPQRR